MLSGSRPLGSRPDLLSAPAIGTAQFPGEPLDGLVLKLGRHFSLRFAPVKKVRGLNRLQKGGSSFPRKRESSNHRVRFTNKRRGHWIARSSQATTERSIRSDSPASQRRSAVS